MRGRRLRTHQKPGRFACPYCGKRFADVLRHLNHRESKCSGWFLAPPSPTNPTSSPLPEPANEHEPADSMDDAPFSPPTIDSEPDPPLPRTKFPTASKIYGRAKSFIDCLNDDKYAPYRVQNPYYPFADQEEWELGSFLLRSGMSMQKLDEFLKLKLVCQNFRPFRVTFTDFYPGQGCWDYIPHCKRPTRSY
jgi:hypothetical protein